MNNKYNSLLYGDELYERLIERNELLIQLVEEKNKEIEKSPKGKINIGVCKRGTLYPQYYVKFDSDEKRAENSDYPSGNNWAMSIIGW